MYADGHIHVRSKRTKGDPLKLPCSESAKKLGCPLIVAVVEVEYRRELVFLAMILQSHVTFIFVMFSWA